MTSDDLQRWFRARPWWLQLMLIAGVGVLLVAAGEAAFPSFAVLPATGPFTAASFVTIWRERQFWGLRRADRLTVGDTMRSGTTSGSSTLDHIAIDRLTRRAKSFRSDRVVAPAVFGVAACIPVVAAVRTDNAWWLLGALALLVTLVVLGGVFRQDPRPQLASLTAHPA